MQLLSGILYSVVVHLTQRKATKSSAEDAISSGTAAAAGAAAASPAPVASRTPTDSVNQVPPLAATGGSQPATSASQQQGSDGEAALANVGDSLPEPEPFK